MIVAQPRQLLWTWLNQRIGVHWSDDFRALGLVKSDCLKAVIGYNGFTGRACFMHSAIDDRSAINRTFVQASFEYPFEQLNLREVLAPVPEENTQALRLNFKLGFKEVYRIPGGSLEGKDLLLLRMRKDECRWIKENRNGWKERTSPAGLYRRNASAITGQQGAHDAADVGKPPRPVHTVGATDLERIFCVGPLHGTTHYEMGKSNSANA